MFYAHVLCTLPRYPRHMAFVVPTPTTTYVQPRVERLESGFGDLLRHQRNPQPVVVPTPTTTYVQPPVERLQSGFGDLLRHQRRSNRLLYQHQQRHTYKAVVV